MCCNLKPWQDLHAVHYFFQCLVLFVKEVKNLKEEHFFSLQLSQDYTLGVWQINVVMTQLPKQDAPWILAHQSEELD